ncbi:hypothetical protein GCM10009540_37880 [Streptomyces turgidiscabies]|nr:hypothetical protein T45_04511 [Streptomyces turgidiscabies]
MLITLGPWLVGRAMDQSASFAHRAESSAFLLPIGEAGDWLRRGWKANPARARQASLSAEFLAFFGVRVAM